MQGLPLLIEPAVALPELRVSRKIVGAARQQVGDLRGDLLELALALQDSGGGCSGSGGGERSQQRQPDRVAGRVERLEVVVAPVHVQDRRRVACLVELLASQLVR